MSMRTKTNTTITKTLSESIDGTENEFELSDSPSSIMDYKNHFLSISPNGDLAVIGYLVDDHDCENPLEIGDGEGQIYTRGRHATRESKQAFNQALGLNSYGDPDIDEGEVEERYVAHFIENMSAADCIENCGAQEIDELDELFVERSARYDFGLGDSARFPKVLDEIRVALQAESADALAVPLDIYEHSGISYSVSGEGMQDRWDTTRYGAIWVPDDSARENIKYNAMKSLLPEGTQVEYLSSPEKLNDITFTLPDGTQQGGFKSFTEGIVAAAGALGIVFDESAVNEKMLEQAREYARSVANEYTMWCNGEVYGVVVNDYKKDLDGQWELTDEDSCYGFIGGDYAEEQMNETAKFHADRHVEMNICDNSLVQAQKIAGQLGEFAIVDKEINQDISGRVEEVTDRHVIVNAGRGYKIVGNDVFGAVSIIKGAYVDISIRDGKSLVDSKIGAGKSTDIDR